METKLKIITYSNYTEIINNDIEEITIKSNIDVSKLNLPYSIKILNIEKLKSPLSNLPFSLEKINITTGCKCCITKSKIPFKCEVNLISEKGHDNIDPGIYSVNYNILRIMSGMLSIAYSN